MLIDYPQLLTELNDAERLFALANDEHRHARLFEATGGDFAALTEVTTALHILTNRPEPSLAKICLLARRRDNLINRNKDIPEQLLRTWIRPGRVNRAYATAQSIPDPSQRARALTHLFETLVETGQIDHAEALANTTPDGDTRSAALADIAQALASAGDIDRADAIADKIPSDRDVLTR